MVYLISGFNFDNTIIVKHDDYSRKSVKTKMASFTENWDGIATAQEKTEHGSCLKGVKNGENWQRSVLLS